MWAPAAHGFTIKEIGGLELLAGWYPEWRKLRKRFALVDLAH
jgi:hypothetical protein